MSVLLMRTNGARLFVEEAVVDAVVEKLDEKLREWEAATANEVRHRIIEIIELADEDALDLLRSRVAEQEVMDLLDEAQPCEVWLADLGLAAKSRPVLIVSRPDPDPPRALVIYVPLTTQNRESKYEDANVTVAGCRRAGILPCRAERD